MSNEKRKFYNNLKGSINMKFEIILTAGIFLAKVNFKYKKETHLYKILGKSFDKEYY